MQNSNEKVAVFWFRRDLRLDDNHGLSAALSGDYPVLPIFIFDDEITDELDRDDARITFIYDQLRSISTKLRIQSSSLLCLKGKPLETWKNLLDQFDIQAVYANEDYEPYAIKRDENVAELLAENGVTFHLFKDQVIFEKDEVMKGDGTPYTVYTPFKNKWREHFNAAIHLQNHPTSQRNFLKAEHPFPTLSVLGFERSSILVLDYDITQLDDYKEVRNIPSLNQTSHLSPHLRFGTVSIRRLVGKVLNNETFLNELIWREFFMQILYHFPKVVNANFRKKYDGIQWRNNEAEFEKWKNGQTGYPMVDAGMRELNTTGYMHNRVRMVVASFLCKHLLIDWKWGEAYFAKKLLDYELSANNGNWQWAAGTGCDAAPYFRVFNPTEQVKKFDPDLKYVKKWVPELETWDYPTPMVEHKMARVRAIETYKEGIALSEMVSST